MIPHARAEAEAAGRATEDEGALMDVATVGRRNAGVRGGLSVPIKCCRQRQPDCAGVASSLGGIETFWHSPGGFDAIALVTPGLDRRVPFIGDS